MVHRVGSRHQIRTMLIFLATWAIFTLTAGPEFLSPRNLSNLFRQATVLGIAAAGLQFVVISGNVDIAIGVLTGFCSIFANALQTVLLKTMPGIVATIFTILAILVLTSLVGTAQGFLVGRFRLPAIVVSLGMSMLLVGLIPLATLGVTFADVDSSLVFLGQGYLGTHAGTVIALSAIIIYALLIRRDIRQRRYYELEVPGRVTIAIRLILFSALILAFKIHVADGYRGLPAPVLILVMLTLLFSHVLSATRFGIRCQAIGFSPSVAGFSGVRVVRCIIGTYTISAVAAGLAGVILTGYTSFGVFGNSMGLSFAALAACLVGLIGFDSERLAVPGAVFGALLLAGLDNWMVLADLRPWLQEFIRGLLLLIIAFVAVRSGRGANIFSGMNRNLR